MEGVGIESCNVVGGFRFCTLGVASEPAGPTDAGRRMYWGSHNFGWSQMDHLIISNLDNLQRSFVLVPRRRRIY